VATAFLCTVQDTFLLTSPHFRHRQAGTITILDGSGKPSTAGRQGKKLVGILEYWWRGKATAREFEAARMVGFVGDKFLDAVSLPVGKGEKEGRESGEE
jgi:hypothetical protein